MKTIPLFLLLQCFTNGKKERDNSLTERRLLKGSENKLRMFNRMGPPPKLPPITDYVFPGPMFYENNIDPTTGLKAPIDFLELRMIYPQTEEEKRFYLKNAPLKDIQFIKPPSILYNPRDRIINDLNETQPSKLSLLFNYEYLQSKNLNQEPMSRRETPKKVAPSTYENIQETNVFSKKSFEPSSAPSKIKNRRQKWTTCDEFKKKSVFHPKDLLDIDWVPFYVWTVLEDAVAVVHKFSVPTVKAVMEYKKEYGPYLSENVDWNQPKLLLEEDVQVLLIAADQSGLFYGIQDQKVSDYVKTHPEAKYPVMIMRMKIVDPYLAMMYCDDYYAVIMAIKGQEPATDKLKTEEAKFLNFTGKGYPVCIDLKRESDKIEWERLEKIQQEESKYIKIRDEDYDVPRDKYLERW